VNTGRPGNSHTHEIAVFAHQGWRAAHFHALRANQSGKSVDIGVRRRKILFQMMQGGPAGDENQFGADEEFDYPCAA
jgi:hypothetical protein